MIEKDLEGQAVTQDPREKKALTFKFLIHLMSPCLAIFEGQAKYIHTGTFIHQAIYGEEFCKSAKKLHYLKVRNDS